MSLEITAIADDGGRRLSVAGEVDVSCADELRSAIDAQIAEGAGAGSLFLETPHARAFLFRIAPALEILHIDVPDGSQRAGADEFAGTDGSLPVAVGEADGGGQLPGGNGVLEAQHRGGIDGYGLFAADGFACLHGRQRHRHVHVVGRADIHRVDIRASEQFAVIPVAAGSVHAVLLRKCLQAGAVDIAEGDQLSTFCSEVAAGVSVRDAARSDDTLGQLVVGSDVTRASEYAARHDGEQRQTSQSL